MSEAGRERIRDLIELEAFLFDGVPAGKHRSDMVSKRACQDPTPTRLPVQSRFDFCINEAVRVIQEGTYFGEIAPIHCFSENLIGLAICGPSDNPASLCWFEPEEVESIV